MAGVRGVRNPMPKKGGSPSKMFTGASHGGPHEDVKRYAHSGGGEKKKPTGGSPNERHQKPMGVRSSAGKSCSLDKWTT